MGSACSKPGSPRTGSLSSSRPTPAPPPTTNNNQHCTGSVAPNHPASPIRPSSQIAASTAEGCDDVLHHDHHLLPRFSFDINAGSPNTGDGGSGGDRGGGDEANPPQLKCTHYPNNLHCQCCSCGSGDTSKTSFSLSLKAPIADTEEGSAPPSASSSGAPTTTILVAEQKFKIPKSGLISGASAGRSNIVVQASASSLARPQNQSSTTSPTTTATTSTAASTVCSPLAFSPSEKKIGGGQNDVNNLFSDASLAAAMLSVPKRFRSSSKQQQQHDRQAIPLPNAMRLTYSVLKAHTGVHDVDGTASRVDTAESSGVDASLAPVEQQPAQERFMLPHPVGVGGVADVTKDAQNGSPTCQDTTNSGSGEEEDRLPKNKMRQQLQSNQTNDSVLFCRTTNDQNTSRSNTFDQTTEAALNDAAAVADLIFGWDLSNTDAPTAQSTPKGGVGRVSKHHQRRFSEFKKQHQQQQPASHPPPPPALLRCDVDCLSSTADDSLLSPMLQLISPTSARSLAFSSLTNSEANSTKHGAA